MTPAIASGLIVGLALIILGVALHFEQRQP